MIWEAEEAFHKHIESDNISGFADQQLNFDNDNSDAENVDRRSNDNGYIDYKEFNDDENL